MIRVLIGDDSSTVRFLLTKILSADPEIEIVGKARNGREVVELAQILRPDLITMDIRMPVMNGFEATKEIMSNTPCPILVVSSSVNDEDLNIAFNAIHYGALDIIEKPSSTLDSEFEKVGQHIIKKIKVLSGVKVLTRRFNKYDRVISDNQAKITKTHISHIPKIKVIGIVSSTGGPVVLKSILSKLPKNFPIPICIVQHIAHGFGKGLVDWLSESCALDVKFGEHREFLKGGTIYIAKDDYHMEVTEHGYLNMHQEDTRYGLRPCGDIMLSSMGHNIREKSVGIILTGMGSDGAYGMQIIDHEGGMTIAQDEASCLVYGMPKEAVNGGCIRRQMNPDQIVQYLLTLVEPN